MSEKIACLQWITLSLTPAFGKSTFRHWREVRTPAEQDYDLHATMRSPLWQKALELEVLCSEYSIEAICWDDPRYPTRLRESQAAVPVLYVQGTLADSQYPLAMVGTRTPSWNGKASAQALMDALREYPVSIVSGLAVGIDCACHGAALERGLHTVAVLAHGLDLPITGERGRIAQQILAQGGALLSPFPPGTPAWRGNFLARNAIIAGLSEATLIIESREQGGALNTAEHCLADQRLLLAIPGDILRETSQGPNMLIESTEATAIWIPSQLPLLCRFAPRTASPANATPIMDILSLFSGETCRLEEIVERSGLSQAELLCSLSLLELDGQVKNCGGMLFQFARVAKKTTTAALDS